MTITVNQNPDLIESFLVEVDDNKTVNNNHGAAKKVRKQVGGNDYFFNPIPSLMGHVRNTIRHFMPFDSIAVRGQHSPPPETNTIKNQKPSKWMW